MDDIALVVTSFFSNLWRLFSGVQIPALGMTAAQLAIGFFVIGFSLKLISLITGFNTGADGGTGISRHREKQGAYRRTKRTNIE